MSNPTRDHPSIRVYAPPGGRSNNIFGTADPEPAAASKKNHMDSDIFGCKKDNTTEAAAVKQQHNAGNNIFGNEPAPTTTGTNPRIHADKNKSTIFGEEQQQQQPTANRPDRQRSSVFGTDEAGGQSAKNNSIADQHKQAQMRSNIFAGNDQAPSTGRNVSDKNRSNIFGVGDDEQAKRQPGGRQGVRVGYNPINGESYSTKDGLNPKNEQKPEAVEAVSTDKTVEEENGQHSENGNGHPATENVEKPANGQEKAANGHDNATNGKSAAKNMHTDVRVLQPPGGRSNGPLW